MEFLSRSFRCIVLLLIFVSLSNQATGQNPTSRIEKLDLGTISLSLSASGTNLGTDIWGRFAGKNYFPWLTVSENPAFVSGEKNPKILFQFIPGQTFNLTRFYDISGIINEEIDGAVADYKADELRIGYPTLNLKLKRKIQWPEGMILFPVEGFIFGLLFHRALDLNVSSDWISTGTSISTEINSGGSVNKVVLNNYIDATNTVEYLSTSSSFFLSKMIRNGWLSGLQIERLYFDLQLQSNINIQGTMYYNEKEFLFNDPNTLWPTDLRQTLDANYTGSTWRMNWGNMVVLKSNFIADAVLSVVSDAVLEGHLDGVRHKVPALNIKALKSGGGVDEILDAENLDLSKLTYTESIGWNQSPSLTHTLPDFIKLGFLYRPGLWSFYLSDRVYFGSYKLRYGEDYIDIDPKHRFNLYIAKGPFYSRFGLYVFSYFAPDRQDFSMQTSAVYLPSAVFGYGRQFMDRTYLVANFDLLPVLGLNVGLQYQF